MFIVCIVLIMSNEEKCIVNGGERKGQVREKEKKNGHGETQSKTVS